MSKPTIVIDGITHNAISQVDFIDQSSHTVSYYYTGDAGGPNGAPIEQRHILSGYSAYGPNGEILGNYIPEEPTPPPPASITCAVEATGAEVIPSGGSTVNASYVVTSRGGYIVNSSGTVSIDTASVTTRTTIPNANVDGVTLSNIYSDISSDSTNVTPTVNNKICGLLNYPGTQEGQYVDYTGYIHGGSINIDFSSLGNSPVNTCYVRTLSQTPPVRFEYIPTSLEGIRSKVHPSGYVFGRQGTMPEIEGDITVNTILNEDDSIFYMLEDDGYYLGQRTYMGATYGAIVNAISLTSPSIASGKTVLGVSGNFTADGTQTAGNTLAGSNQILSGYSAWANGAEVIGTYSPSTPTPTTQSKNITTNGTKIEPDQGYDGLSSAISMVEFNKFNPTGLAGTKWKLPNDMSTIINDVTNDSRLEQIDVDFYCIINNRNVYFDRITFDVSSVPGPRISYRYANNPLQPQEYTPGVSTSVYYVDRWLYGYPQTIYLLSDNLSDIVSLIKEFYTGGAVQEINDNLTSTKFTFNSTSLDQSLTLTEKSIYFYSSGPGSYDYFDKIKAEKNGNYLKISYHSIRLDRYLEVFNFDQWTTFNSCNLIIYGGPDATDSTLINWLASQGDFTIA